MVHTQGVHPRRLPLFLSLCLPACGSGWSPPEEALVHFDGPPPRNVLILSIDTLRRDRVGRYDGSNRSPTLDRLLGEGVVLEDHRSCSNWTYASMLCVVAGSDQEELGFAPQRSAEELDVVPDGIDLLAEQLGDHRSSLVSANPLLGVDTGTAGGFERSCTDCVLTTSAERIISRGLEELDALQETGDPWLLQLHFMEPHLPYAAPESYLDGLEELPAIPWNLSEGSGLDAAHESWEQLDAGTRSAVVAHSELLYNAQIAYLDDQLAGLIEQLEVRSALSDTLVMLLSDHGEQFFDHGGIKHGSSLYAEETRAIAGFWAEGLEPAAWELPTSHRDLAPTLLSALGLEPPGSWSGQVVGTGSPDRARFTTVLSAEAGATRQSVELDGLRLIYSWDGELELYDLQEDPNEQVDLFFPGHPEASALWPLLLGRVGALGALESAPAAVAPDL